jgi:hypothetical protein
MARQRKYAKNPAKTVGCGKNKDLQEHFAVIRLEESLLVETTRR